MELKFCGATVKLSTESTELSTGYLLKAVQKKSRRRVSSAAIFCGIKFLVLHHVNIHMVVGHLDTVLCKGAAQVFVQAKIDIPIVAGISPAEDGVFDGKEDIEVEVTENK